MTFRELNITHFYRRLLWQENQKSPSRFGRRSFRLVENDVASFAAARAVSIENLVSVESVFATLLSKV
jgi:hypothetical protein